MRKERTVRQFVSCGDLKAHKAGGKWIVTADSLKEFFNASTKPEPSNKAVGSGGAVCDAG